MIEPELRAHQSYKPRNIQAEIWKQYGVKISYWVTWRGRAKALEIIHGNYDQSYIQVPQLAKHILNSNPGTIAKYGVDEYDKFRCFCLSFKASLDGFKKGCRPIIGLDGCFLKEKYGGVCLSATSLDANNGLFPLAIYRSESAENWTSFLKLLAPMLHHDLPVTFFSDRQKDMILAVEAVFPNGNQRFCMRHIYSNFKKQHKEKALESIVWRLARAYTVVKHGRCMEKLMELSDGDWAWMKAKPFNLWCRDYFEHTVKCEHLTNNFSESFNSWMTGLRDLPVCQFVEKLHLKIVTLMFDRRKKAREWSVDDVVPRAKKLYESHKAEYHKYIYRGAIDSELG